MLTHAAVHSNTKAHTHTHKVLHLTTQPPYWDPFHLTLLTTLVSCGLIGPHQTASPVVCIPALFTPFPPTPTRSLLPPSTPSIPPALPHHSHVCLSLAFISPSLLNSTTGDPLMVPLLDINPYLPLYIFPCQQMICKRRLFLWRNMNDRVCWADRFLGLHGPQEAPEMHNFIYPSYTSLYNKHLQHSFTHEKHFLLLFALKCCCWISCFHQHTPTFLRTHLSGILSPSRRCLCDGCGRAGFSFPVGVRVSRWCTVPS